MHLSFPLLHILVTVSTLLEFRAVNKLIIIKKYIYTIITIRLINNSVKCAISFKKNKKKQNLISKAQIHIFKFFSSSL